MQIVNSLKGGEAYIPISKALKNINPGLRNIRPNEKLHSVWEELEHMRLAQEDLLKYMIDPNWKSPKWPEGYWPAPGAEFNNDLWDQTRGSFLKDLEEVTELAADPLIDLLKIIPHTKSHTYLREFLIIIGHNAYHLGKIVDIRKALGDWKR